MPRHFLAGIALDAPLLETPPCQRLRRVRTPVGIFFAWLSDLLFSALWPDFAEENAALQEEVSESLAGLADAPLVDSSVLVATWPRVFSSPDRRDFSRGGGHDESESDISSVEDRLSGLSVHEKPTHVAPLKQLALRKLLGGILAEATSSAESLRAVGDLVETPLLHDCLPTVREALEKVKALNEAGFLLLKALIANEHSSLADLTPWTTARGLKLVSLVSDKQILDLAPGLAARRIDTLDISGHQELSATQLSSLVASIPTVTRVIALHCPNVDSDADSSPGVASPAVAFVRTGLLHAAFGRMRVRGTGTSWPEMVDLPHGKPAPALSVLVASAAYEFYTRHTPVRHDYKAHVYGCELPSFTKAGVVAGFFWLLEHIFANRGAAGKAGRFDFRAGFHRLDGSIRTGKDWIVEDGEPTTREAERLAMGRSMGGIPSDLALPPHVQQAFPRLPGWTLALSTCSPSPIPRSVNSPSASAKTKAISRSSALATPSSTGRSRTMTRWPPTRSSRTRRGWPSSRANAAPSTRT